MLRAILACSVLSFCVAAPAAASGDDVARSELGSMQRAHGVGAAPVAPLVPEHVATDWCERPEDPRCSPASPAPSSPLAVALSTLPSAVPPHAPPAVAPARLAATPRPSTLLLGPRAGVRNRIERPPA